MRDNSRRTPRAVAPANATTGLVAAKKVARHAAQEVRIIGGEWRRTPLAVPVSAGLRPTPSRVRETLFNWLGQDMHGWTVLDAYAGSGALGLEAASRGAAKVTLVERDPQLAKAIRATVAKLKAEDRVHCQQGDAIAWMQQMQRQGQIVDLIFLDPPFDDDVFEPALRAAVACLPEGGYVYLESPRAYELAPETQLDLVKQGQAGAVHFHLFRRRAD